MLISYHDKQDSFIKNNSVCIIDESHNFPSICQKQFSQEINTRVVRDQIDTMKNITKQMIKEKIAKKKNKYMVSDCPLAGKHLKQLEFDTNISNDEAIHPIEILAKAYRLV